MQRVLGLELQALKHRCRLFGYEVHLYCKMLENHSQTIFLTKKLDDSIKQVTRHHVEPSYSILY